MIYPERDRAPEDEPKQVLASDPSPHALLKRAIDVADGDDSIVLTVEAAMALITEFETGMAPLPLPEG